MGRERTDACPKSETKIRKLRIGGTKVLKRTVASHKSRKDNSGHACGLLNKHFFFFIIKPTQKSRNDPITNFLFILFTTLRKSRKVNSGKRVRHVVDAIIEVPRFKWAWAIGHGLGIKVGWAEENLGLYWWAYPNGPKKKILFRFYFIFFT